MLARHVPRPDGAGAWWRAAGVLCWIAGVASQLQQPRLWEAGAYLIVVASGVAAACVSWVASRWHWRGLARVVAGLAACALAFGFAGWRAHGRLADALAPAWEGCDIELVGVVAEMPQLADDGAHFAFVVESARAAGMSARDLKAVQRLDLAAGRPLAAAVLAAEQEAARARGPADVERRPAESSDRAARASAAGDGPALASPASDGPALASAASDGVEDADDTVTAPPPLPPPPPGAGTPVVPSRVWLSWSRNQRDDRAVAPSPAPLRAGQRWRLPVRLRQPHGAMNPDGFDAELWLFEQGLRATGAVRGNGQLLDEGWAPIERARQAVRDRLMLSGEGSDAADASVTGALAALAVGDQAAIDLPGWELFRNTGVAHLMSISGLHITMLAWLGGAAIAALWRRSERAALWLPTPSAARWGGVGVAWLYALLAGWGVPAQRTVLMLAATALLRGAGLDWPASLVALAAMLPVTLLDPWALLQPGFWLSFAAVGLLMVSEPVRGSAGAPGKLAGKSADERRELAAGLVVGRAGPAVPRAFAVARHAAHWLPGVAYRLAGAVRGGLRAQVVASIGLAPLTLVAFQQVSLVGLVCNLVAEPWITLVVTPLTLSGIAVPSLWRLAALALRPLLWLLGVLARWPLASVHVATPPGWALATGLAGGALLMLPLPWRVRLLALPLLLPLLWPFVARPAAGRFELVAADIGQGTAVLVRTRDHLLLFDTGPRFGEDNDAGRRLLLPLLQARGEPRVDLLMLSHADADHVGGAQSIIDRLPVRALRSSLDERNPLRVANALPHVPCLAGQRWDWDGVRFSVLHPFAGDYRPGAKPNSISCVLRVVDQRGTSALLTGDVEAPGEGRLVARARGEPAASLRSDILVVPHHGSRTSSTDAFLDAVRPGVAVIQVGYRSRYGHPAPDVVARHAAHGIPVVRTDHCGAWLWSGGAARCARDVRRRYWQWTGAAPPLTPPWIGPAPEP